jgi:energy-coupling factor transporter ATP-binding protein EcfA2
MSELSVISPDQMFSRLEFFADRGENIYFHGASGIGKSTIIKAFAKYAAEKAGLTFYEVDKDPAPANLEKAYAYIEFLTGSQDVLDIKGAPEIVDGKTAFRASDQLPDETVHGKFGMWFLDEIASGGASVTNALSMIIEAKKSGAYVFPANWFIAAASNRKKDHANIQKIGAQVNNRFGHFEVEATAASWSAYRIGRGSTGLVPAFIRFRAQLLHHFVKGDIAFCSPRVWEKVDRYWDDFDDVDFRQSVVASWVGVGPAMELEGFSKIVANMVSWKDIKASPDTVNVPDRHDDQGLATIWALIGVVGKNVDRDSLDAAVTYIRRFDIEFQEVFFLDLKAKQPKLLDTTTVSQWRADNPNSGI